MFRCQVVGPPSRTDCDQTTEGPEWPARAMRKWLVGRTPIGPGRGSASGRLLGTLTAESACAEHAAGGGGRDVGTATSGIGSRREGAGRRVRGRHARPSGAAPGVCRCWPLSQRHRRCGRRGRPGRGIAVSSGGCLGATRRSVGRGPHSSVPSGPDARAFQIGSCTDPPHLTATDSSVGGSTEGRIAGG